MSDIFTNFIIAEPDINCKVYIHLSCVHCTYWELNKLLLGSCL